MDPTLTCSSACPRSRRQYEASAEHVNITPLFLSNQRARPLQIPLITPPTSLTCPTPSRSENNGSFDLPFPLTPPATSLRSSGPSFPAASSSSSSAVAAAGSSDDGSAGGGGAGAGIRLVKEQVRQVSETKEEEERWAEERGEEARGQDERDGRPKGDGVSHFVSLTEDVVPGKRMVKQALQMERLKEGSLGGEGEEEEGEVSVGAGWEKVSERLESSIDRRVPRRYSSQATRDGEVPERLNVL